VSYARLYFKLGYYVVSTFIIAYTAWSVAWLAVEGWHGDIGTSMQLILAVGALVLFMLRLINDGVLKYVDKIRLKRVLDKISAAPTSLAAEWGYMDISRWRQRMDEVDYDELRLRALESAAVAAKIARDERQSHPSDLSTR
jgi:hypothetical protein